MFIVAVEFTIKQECLADFMPLMVSNAEASLNNEVDCHQFDVCQIDDQPQSIFLYEVYTHGEAFQLHLASPHFKEFDAAVGHMIERKQVRTYTRVLP